MPVLLVVAGPQTGTRFVFERDILLGRSSECDLCVRDGRMSRRHARLLVGKEGVALDDLGSRNGTFLNDVRVTGATPLAGGDCIRVGETELLFEPSVDLVPARHTGGVVVVDALPGPGDVKLEASDRRRDAALVDEASEVEPGLLASRLASRLSPLLDAGGVLGAGLAEVAAALRADRGAIILAARRGRRLSPAAMVGGEEMVVDRPLIRRVLHSADALLVDSAPRDASLGSEGLGMRGPRILMAAPIGGPTGPAGMMVLERRRESDVDSPWDERALTAIRVAGAMLGTELTRVVEAGRVEAERDFVLREGSAGEPLMVGDGPRLRRLLDEARSVARSEKHVVIAGEPGCGRALLARYIHEHSSRADASLCFLQCAGAQEMDMEALLAGEERDPELGTGKVGALESAHGGALYLDGADRLSQRALNILEMARKDSVLVRMGGSRPVPIDVRLFASTPGPDSGEELARTLFGRRAALIKVPPLRDRIEDIPLLFAHFAELAAASLGRERPVALSAQGRRSAEAYEWPGNVRELRNFVERVSLLQPPGSSIGPAHLPRRGGGGLVSASGTLAEQIATLESAAIAAALEEEGKKTGAARRLGISRPTLDRKMALYGLRLPSTKP